MANIVIKFLAIKISNNIIKKIRKNKLKKILVLYLKVLTFKLVNLTDLHYYNCFFFLTYPQKQIHYQLYLLRYDYHRSLSSGTLLKLDFTHFKFFKKNIKSLTTINLLFWHYFLSFFLELDFIYIKNFNYFIFQFLDIFNNIFTLNYTNILYKKSYIISLLKQKRIKKKIYKLLLKT